MSSVKASILVAEDDAFLMKVYKNKLTGLGYTLHSAGDGEQALSLAREVKPDIMLLDLVMPKKNGFEVLAEVKGDENLKSIPVIILSNLGQETDVEKGKQLGAVDYIIKANVSIDEVVRKIEEHLGAAKYESNTNIRIPSAEPQSEDDLRAAKYESNTNIRIPSAEPQSEEQEVELQGSEGVNQPLDSQPSDQQTPSTPNPLKGEPEETTASDSLLEDQKVVQSGETEEASGESVFCSGCGEALEKGDKFCGGCGSKVE